MKLQLLITQYPETDEIIRPMLESIETQQGVDLKNDIEVIYGNDGSDIKLSEEVLGSFSFPVRYLHFDHLGLPGARGNLLDAATGDYVMFCDADDMFLSNIALYTILSFIEKGFDALVCEFMEEIKNRKTGQAVYFPHKRDRIFVHGKVFRRQFLTENRIRWHPELKGHEDSCFNCLAQRLAKDLKFCDTPIYLWKWRDDSICRKDPLYVPKTYVYMINSNEALVKEFLDRGMLEDARYYTNVLLYGTYYMLNKPIPRCDRR